MGVCPLLLLLGLALGASTQDHVPITSPPNITSKPADPQDTSSVSLTVVHTQAPTSPPTDPPSTVAVTDTEAMMITTAAATTTTIPADEEDVQVPGLTPTDAPPIPPDSETTLLPTLVEEHNITTLPPDTPTPEVYINVDTEDTVETTTEPDERIFTASSPQDNSQSDEMSIIAIMVALSSLLVIIFIIIILYMLRFKKYKQAGSHSNSFRLTNGRSDDTELQSVPLLARSPSTNRKYPPIPVDKLEEEMNRRMADDNKLFREEFNVWRTATHTVP